jgi:phage terminase large subunit GpA-like protein
MRRGIVQPFKDVSKQILRYDFNEDYYKGILHSMLFETAQAGPGHMHLPVDATDEFLAHLTSEEAREIPIRGRRVVIWVNKGGKPNHWWDCLVHARNAAEKVGVRWLDPKATRSPRIEGTPVGHKPIRTRY